jgi:predicted nuclease of predicted toxin-antitoxin system
MSLAIYMDHHVDRRITRGLRDRGCDVLTALGDGYERRSDPDILARATELRRIVFTLDTDFLEIAAHWQAAATPFSGIVFWRTANLSIGTAIHDLQLIASAISAREMANTVVWIPL